MLRRNVSKSKLQINRNLVNTFFYLMEKKMANSKI